jgi:cytochrome c peroxidase
MFRTPSLRDVDLTAPYMHDGSIETLEDVVEHYNDGGNSNPYLELSIRALHLSSHETGDLVAFLKSLSGSNWQRDFSLETPGSI